MTSVRRFASIQTAFAAQAECAPQRIALSAGDRDWSYRELDRASFNLAQRLLAQGARRGGIVALLAPRSAEAIIGMLAILRSGCAYLPLDPAAADSQLQYQCVDAAPLLLLAPSDQHRRLRALLPELPLLALDGTAISTAPLPLPAGSPEDPAYLLYTSGSTGRPKGVLIPHRGVLRLVLDADYVTLGPDEVLLQLAPLGFDASTFEIWGALLNGGRLAIACDAQPSLARIAALITQHRVTTLWLTAGLFHLMVDHQFDSLRPLRQLLAGGDVLSPSHVDRVLGELPDCRLINGYGPTENTTFTCCYTVPAAGGYGRTVPIGTPIHGTEILVLDAGGQPVAEGAAGELLAGGAGLALGYHRRPELTAERFVPHPLKKGEKLYRTGDLVRFRNDGNLEFLGRVDRQVKVNGKRVELDGIEACLHRHPQVREAAVVAVGEAAEQRWLAAFVGRGASDLGADALRSWLSRELPDYMVPSQIRVLDTLPLTPNGKIDRSALLSSLELAAPRPSSASTGTTETLLLDLWREVLGTRNVSADQNFFDAGATSLQLVRLHASIQTRLGRPLSLTDLFAHPRISALAAHLGPLKPPPATAPSSSSQVHS